MTEDKKIQLIEEIKKLERELYLKKSELASEEAKNYGSIHLIASGNNPDEWKKVISELINLIGAHSSGGNSVEDIQRERER